MSEQDATTQDAPEVTETEEQQNPSAEPEESQEDADRDDAWDPERAKRKISKVNSENKALRERATQAEKKAASVDDLTKQNGDLNADNLRLRVGYELGLPLAIAERLKGSTREEMLADAEALVELVAPTKAPATRRPTEKLRGGGEPEREPEETDTRKIAERMFRS